MRCLKATPTGSSATATGPAELITADPGSVVIPQMSITDTFLGGPLLFLFSGDLKTQPASTFLTVAIRQDGVQLAQSVRTEYEYSGAFNTSRIMAILHSMAGPTPGAHTFDVTWRHSGTASNQFTANLLRRSFVIVEFDA